MNRARIFVIFCIFVYSSSHLMSFAFACSHMKYSIYIYYLSTTLSLFRIYKTIGKSTKAILLFVPWKILKNIRHMTHSRPCARDERICKQISCVYPHFCCCFHFCILRLPKTNRQNFRFKSILCEKIVKTDLMKITYESCVHVFKRLKGIYNVLKQLCYVNGNATKCCTAHFFRSIYDSLAKTNDLFR